MMVMQEILIVTMILFIREQVAHRDEIRHQGMVMDTELLVEAKGENIVLHPIRIIDMEIVTTSMIGAVIAMSAVPKRRNVEVLRQKRRSAAEVIASLRVVIIHPRHDGIIVTGIEIEITLLPQVLKGISISKKTNLRNHRLLRVEEATTILESIGILPKEIWRGRRRNKIHSIFRT